MPGPVSLTVKSSHSSRTCRGNLDGAGLREFDRVADQIEQDLLYAVFVDFDQGNLSIDPVEQAQRAFAHEGAGDRQHKLRESMKIGRPTVQLDRLVTQLREIQDVIDEAGEPPAAGNDHTEIASLLFAQRAGCPVQHRLANPDDAVEGRAQLVRRIGKKFVLHGVGPKQGLFCIFSNRDVPDDAGETKLVTETHLAHREFCRERSTRRVAGPPPPGRCPQPALRRF